VGFYLKTNLKSNARNIAKRVGVPEFDAALKAITRPLESYSQKEKLSVT
jgi:hypothetical protein